MKRFLLFLFPLLAMLGGCSEDPNDTGVNLIAPQDTVQILTSVIEATSDTTFLARVIGTGEAMIGSSTAADLEARALLQFSGLTSVPKSATVDSAIVMVRSAYKFPDTSGQLAFTVHELNSTWSSSTSSWDSVNRSSFYATVPDTSWLGRIAGSDTAIFFHIDPLVRKWIQAGNNTPNGIVLIPDRISSNIIVGTQSLLSSVLTIYYRDTADTTVKLVRGATQESFVANANPVPTSQQTIVQAGVGYRSVVRFVPLSIPARVSITRATLELTLDPTASIQNTFTRDTVVAYLLRKNHYPFDSLALATVCSPVRIGGNKIYSADIKSIVQQWVIREPNIGLVFRAYGDASTMDRFAFYGANAPAGMRPRLKISYTIFR